MKKSPKEMKNHVIRFRVTESEHAAFTNQAKEKGFDMAECDVTFTKDGVGVLLHDDTINRTSNGSGKISELTLEEARQYDFGSWKSSEYAGEQIPTFEEFIKLCKYLAIHPYIEIKAGATQENVASLVTTVTRAGMLDRVTWISFDVNLASINGVLNCFL